MENMNKHDLKNYIQRLNFVILDLALYLDTHPECPCAFATYREYQKMYQKAIFIYQNRFEPITIYGVHDEECWSWGNDPWPWQKECGR